MPRPSASNSVSRRRTRHRAIAPLAEAGVLTEFTGMRRTRMWQAREVLTALDDFAARACRRA